MADEVDISESLDALGLTEREINEIAAEEVDIPLRFLANEVRSYWQSLSPDDTGQYDRMIEVYRITGPNGEPGRRINATAEYSHIIEYGSEDTEAYGVRAAVAQAFQCDGPYMVEGS